MERGFSRLLSTGDGETGAVEIYMLVLIVAVFVRRLRVLEDIL